MAARVAVRLWRAEHCEQTAQALRLGRYRLLLCRFVWQLCRLLCLPIPSCNSELDAA